MVEMKDLVAAVATIGDWGGYKIYEWFKLFPEEREQALREYMYLKTHMIQDCAHQVGLKPSLEAWNRFFDQVGTAFEMDPSNLCHATYDGLVDALHAYEGQKMNAQIRIFAERSGIGATEYSKQFVPDLTELFTRTASGLRKLLQA
jgi:hypothetical protein